MMLGGRGCEDGRDRGCSRNSPNCIVLLLGIVFGLGTTSWQWVPCVITCSRKAENPIQPQMGSVSVVRDAP